MKLYNKVILTLQERLLWEKLSLIDYSEYVKLVCVAYEEAPIYDESVAKYWKSLARHTATMFKRLQSDVEIIFTSDDSAEVNQRAKKIIINGKRFKLINHRDPYATASEMKTDYKNTGKLMISIDYSTHPIFTIEDNIMFRSVHDYIIHILGDHPFGAKGEIASYNRQAKIAPPDATPALFTEIVGQASVAVVRGNFPVQKITILPGFDYRNVGAVEGYKIENKKLLANSEDILT